MTTHKLCITVVPLRCGALSLPRITLLWEKALQQTTSTTAGSGGVTAAVQQTGSGSLVKVLDVGGGGGSEGVELIQNSSYNRSRPRHLQDANNQLSVYVRPAVCGLE